MTFPLINPDVDPLSQNQRLTNLEKRPIPPGGSGGGGPYSIPDFDTYPDNTINLYPGVGVVGKITIPPSQQFFPNVELRVCLYKPLLNELPYGPTFFYLRLYNSSVWGLPAKTTSDITKTLPNVDTQDYYDKYMLNVWPTLTNTQILSMDQMLLSPTLYASGQTYVVTVRMDIHIYNKGSTIPSSLRIQTTHGGPANSPNTVNILPAYRFANHIRASDNYMILASNQIYFLPDTSTVNFAGNIAVSTLQDFPDVLKPIYPASWTTP